MFQLHNKTKIALSLEPQDLRKSFNGLEPVVVNDHNRQLNEGAIHLFTNKAKTRLKILHSDVSGIWCATIKILEQKIDALIKRLFSKSSEKLTPEEQLLLFEGNEEGKPQASSSSDLPDVAPDEVKSDVNKNKRKKRSPKLPENLPIIIDKVIIPQEVIDDPDSYEKISADHQDHQDLLDLPPLATSNGASTVLSAYSSHVTAQSQLLLWRSTTHLGNGASKKDTSATDI